MLELCLVGDHGVHAHAPNQDSGPTHVPGHIGAPRRSPRAASWHRPGSSRTGFQEEPGQTRELESQQEQDLATEQRLQQEQLPRLEQVLKEETV